MLNFCWVSHDRLFSAIDTNKDRSISKSELRALIVGINFEEIDLDKEDAIDKLMKDFDTSHNDEIDKGEFFEGIKKWLGKLKWMRPPSGDSGPHTKHFLNFHSVS